MNTIEQPLKFDLLDFGQMQSEMQKSNLLMQWIYSVFELMVRLYLANVFFSSGWTKIQNWSSTLYFFNDEYHVPFLDPGLAAVLATAGELGLSVLLVLGLFNRRSALDLFMVNAIAFYSYYSVLKNSAVAIHDHLHWGLLLLLLMISRNGIIKADRVLAFFLN